MFKNDSWKIWTQKSEEGLVLEIRTHPDRGGLKIRDFGGRPLCFYYASVDALFNDKCHTISLLWR